MSAWERLVKLAKGGDVAGVFRLLLELDAGDRKAVAEQLPRHLSGLRPGDWWSWRHQVRPLRLAGVACLGGAAAVTAWLFRREFQRVDRDDDERLILLLRQRPAEWRADVARRVAARLRLPELRHWELVAALVRETGIEPPDGDAFMVGWLRSLHSRTADTDPLFTAFAPRLFEIDGLSEALPEQVGTIARLVEDGPLERKPVIDGIVGRLLRDGPSALSALVVLHDRLDLDIDEAAERARDYTRLLPAGPVAVVDLALAQLRRLEEAGRLEEELFAEAVEALAFRPEKKLLRAALSWAGDAVLRDARRADVVLAAMSLIFAQDTLALQERAVRLAVKLAPQAGEAGREAVRQAAAGLPAELLERVSAAYGGGIAAEEVTIMPLPAVGQGPALPKPYASPDQLVRAASAREVDPHTFERLLAGLVEWSRRAPDALREALRPWVEPFDSVFFGHNGEDPVHAVRRAFLAFASPEAGGSLPALDIRRPPTLGGFKQLYFGRAAELARSFEAGDGYPVLLATPTAGSGHVDPGVLLDRLELLEAAGVPALAGDLVQALLRLPRDVPDACVRRARRLTSEAGRACAAWMRDGGAPDPRVTVHLRNERNGYYLSGLPALRSVMDVPDDLPEELRPLYRPGGGYAFTLEWWPLAMPSHPEIVAAHMVWMMSICIDSDDAQTQALVGLAHADGPLGSAVAHTLACGMGHANATDRAAATDALLTLAARGRVPAQALGETLTKLVVEGFLKLNRVASVLDDATQAGAHEAVWEVVVRLLPGLLPQEGERPRAGVADLLAAGARAARIAGVRAELPEVAAVAARKGSSRLVQEARRLQHLVTLPKKSTL
ncbi:DUF7825 domain-containing protein [Nonomuraea angiospora]|uniref:DUF7825 domain-containing protein n=1 Tax=Nonomuraea angiospora TaxID=46172 RepID=UPI0029B33E00|nr:DUF6493 family protein [Nonomuraea angiospora]MDX3109678.1 DUF6493 family protein [Nonomuraea angiospora]